MLNEKVIQKIVATNALARFHIVTHSNAEPKKQKNKNERKTISNSESASKIKVRISETVFKVLLMSAVIFK